MVEAQSFRNRILNAGLWSIGGNMVGHIIRLAGNLIVTRLLVPEMFGVMALVNVFYVGLAMISDVGLHQNVIQSKRGQDTQFLNTVWSVQILRGLFIWFLTLGVALLVYLLATSGVFETNSAYADPVLPLALVLMGFNAVISGFYSTNLATANRKLELALITKVELMCQLIGLLVMIAWAYVDRSIWALIAGPLVANLVKVYLSHAIVPGIQNRATWHSQHVREIFSFGKWVFLSSTLSFLALNGDRLLLGGLVDSAFLGMYSIALTLSQVLAMVAGVFFGSVAFPALSEIVREAPDRLKDVYYRFRLPADALLLLAAGALYVSGDAIVALLYDARYLEAGRMFEILCVSLVYVRYTIAEWCFVALGKPKLLIPTKIAQLAALGMLPIVHATYGSNASLWLIALSCFAGLPFVVFFKQRLGLMSFWREIAVLPVFIIGVAVGRLIEWLL